MQDHLQRMHNEIESTTRKLELEKRRLNKLDEEVERVRAEHREKVIKANNSDDKVAGVVSVKKLENRLAKAISTLNASLHENEGIRARIDDARRERLHMNQVFKKVQAEIKDNQAQVKQLQRESDMARHEEEECKTRLAALRKQLEIERRQFNGNVQKLQRDLKDQHREDVLQRVAVVRDAPTEEERKQKTQSLKADEEDNFHSETLMRRILKHAFLNAIQRRRIRQHQKNIEVFEQAFATIKSTTGISDIEEIVRIFVILEQRNFSLLTYVNALNSDIESLDKQNRELEDQFQMQRKMDEEGQKTRTGALTDLVQQIEAIERATHENYQQAEQQSEIMERCKPWVQSVLKTVDRENRGFGGDEVAESPDNDMLGWLTSIERTLTQWKDFLPEAKAARSPKGGCKGYKYTVGQQAFHVLPKKHQATPALVKLGELPSSLAAHLDQAGQPKGNVAAREDDSSDEEEDLQSHPWSRQELRDKAVAAVSKRRRHRKLVEAPSVPVAPGAVQEQTMRPVDSTSAVTSLLAPGAAAEHVPGPSEPAPAGDPEHVTSVDLSYDELVERTKDADEASVASQGSHRPADGPTDEQINEIFLKRYKMSKEDLQRMADKMGVKINNLCYLKQEFDGYDEDRSGYIDVKELKSLLEKLGEELSEEELEKAFKELDGDGSGEIEFFEFVEWFTSED